MVALFARRAERGEAGAGEEARVGAHVRRDAVRGVERGAALGTLGVVTVVFAFGCVLSGGSLEMYKKTHCGCAPYKTRTKL